MSSAPAALAWLNLAFPMASWEEKVEKEKVQRKKEKGKTIKEEEKEKYNRFLCFL